MTLYAIMSDIHANEEALDAVLRDIDSKGIKNILCLGDIVGYGPRPKECIAKIRERNIVSVRGNHDDFVSGLREMTEEIIEVARTSLDWTIDQISDEDKKYLYNLSSLDVRNGFTMVHCTPFSKGEYIYIRGKNDAFSYIFEVMKEIKSQAILEKISLVFLGHYHQPALYRANKEKLEGFDDSKALIMHDGPIELDKDYWHVVNCGSVGQPRDNDPRSCYVTYDSEKHSLQFYRVEYDIKKVQEQIRKEKLPERLAERLGLGN